MIQPSKIIGLGAGGHGQVIADILTSSDKFVLEAWLDPQTSLHNSSICGAPVLGGDEFLANLAKLGITHAFIGAGSIGDSSIRQRIYHSASKQGLEMPVLIAPSAVVSSTSHLGPGSCVFPLAVVNTNTSIHEGCIINSHATVEHDCTIESFVHVAPAAVVAGGVYIGMGSHIGAGAIIKEGVHIGENVIVGAGSVVLQDVPPSTTVVGCPAKSIER